jgi:hypothetical protein
LPNFLDNENSCWRPIAGRKQLSLFNQETTPNGYRLFSGCWHR